ncbi:phosphatidylglycerol lysyltransferase domain-containing protein [Metabacillus herbersteinensis]|uniref:Phosphatidylglycerol lysyltransferase domain-containing protein n=1 Tax=Metabacillus herbersteinensis TaxID=283816 RepID=A0ABV6GC05_9BACI
MSKILLLIIVVLIISYIIVRTRPKNQLYKEYDYNIVAGFLKTWGGHHLSHLLFLKDKDLFWAQDQQVLFSYRKVANKMIVLGDPIGNEALFSAAIKEFIEYCRSSGNKPVFYQVSPMYMSLYHEYGFRFLKIGEEAKVQLNEFSLEGKKVQKLRTTKNKFLREGYQFTVVLPPYSNRFFNELRDVSTSWLEDRQEKGYSVGFFNEEYVSAFPVAVLRNAEGNLLAFATLAYDYQHNGRISIDLMRYNQNSPNGTMDMVFISSFLWAKEEGFTTCSIGMSPLSNVGNSPYSPFKEKLCKYMFQHGGKFYSFKGLRAYKNKFASVWEPRYVAYKQTHFLLILMQITYLVHQQPLKRKISQMRIPLLTRKVG